jgi:HKD family nuclease
MGTGFESIEFLVLPYDSLRRTGSLVARLTSELRSTRWDTFEAAVAFAKESGNYAPLLNALVSFVQRGGAAYLTFGADSFQGKKGSDFAAIEGLLERLDGLPGAHIFLFRDGNRTFHPKVYLFSNRERRRALLVVGSSNWSTGGLCTNVEANLVVTLDLSSGPARRLHSRVRRILARYWRL